MRRCIGLTRSGKRCRITAWKPWHTCVIHADQEWRAHAAQPTTPTEETR